MSGLISSNQHHPDINTTCQNSDVFQFYPNISYCSLLNYCKNYNGHRSEAKLPCPFFIEYVCWNAYTVHVYQLLMLYIRLYSYSLSFISRSYMTNILWLNDIVDIHNWSFCTCVIQGTLLIKQLTLLWTSSLWQCCCCRRWWCGGACSEETRSCDR